MRAALLTTLALFAVRPALAHAQATPADSAAVDSIVLDERSVTTTPELLDARMVQREIADAYPRGLRDLGIDGEVTLELVISRAGRVEASRVAYTTDRRFSDAALSVARHMRFRPARVGDVPVRCRFRVPVTFDIVR